MAVSKIFFRHRSDLRLDTRRKSCGGSHEANEYKVEIIDGIRTPVVASVTNVNDYVQASLPDTLIYNLLDRYGGLDNYVDSHGGPAKVLEEISDFTQMPKTLAEAQQLAIDAKNRFESLPMAFRARFDNNVDLFIRKLSDGSAKEEVSSYFGTLGIWDKNGQYIRKQPSVKPENISKEVAKDE